MRDGKRVFERADDHEQSELRAYRAGRWFQAALLGDAKAVAYCGQTKGFGLVRGASEGQNSTGGLLVPIEIENAIIAQRALAGIMRQEADVRTLGSDVRSLPRRASGLAVYFITEGTAAAETNVSFDDVSLVTRKAGALLRISSELNEDEAADLGRFLIEDFGNALAALEDGCGFNGDGTSTYNGMTDGAHNAGKVTAASGHDTFPKIDATDLGALMGALPEQFWPNAKWYASSFAIGNTFARMGMTAGGLVDAANGPRQQFYYAGFPVVPTNRLPASATSQSGAVMIAFGDLRNAAMLGARRGLTIRASEHPYFANDQLAIIGTQRFDVVVHSLGDNTTAGPLVGLVGN
jgi:HK97 family phage major capsid protein